MQDIPNRPNKLARVFIDLETEAQWSTCQRLRVASALVTPNDFQILVLARNGAPSGQPHCYEVVRPDERCVICIHSEKNIINRAAKMGISTYGQGLVTLYRPCLGCSNDILEAGISFIYYRYEYDTDQNKEYVMNMLNRKIGIMHVPMSVEEQTFHAMIAGWRKTWTTTK